MSSQKTISAVRDRRQSAGLVLVVGAALLSGFPYGALPEFGLRWNAEVLGVSLTFAALVWRLRAATAWGAFWGGMLCYVTTLLTGNSSTGLIHSSLPPLATLFALTFAATRIGRTRKETLGLAEAKTGRRASQVLANLGVAGLVCVFSRRAMWMDVALLAALAEATADTVSSEIGQAFGGQPRLLFHMRRVSPGTDGAVSLAGTLAGIAAATCLMLVGLLSMPITFRQSALALLGGLAGFFLDTVLGATVERRGSLGNDLVNFTSTLFAVLAAVLLLQIR